MKKNLNRGFTLIELLVVIAIIGILASVVLASLNTARAKGADAKIKAELSNARAQAELFYDSNGANGYSGVCTALSSATPGGINNLFTSAAATGGATTTTVNNAAATTTTVANCHDTTAGWAMEIPLKVSGAGFYCVDSKMKSQTNAAAGLTTGAGDIDC